MCQGDKVMFRYKDPSGTLTPAKALTNYRQLLHAQYRLHAKLPKSAFTLLDAFAEMAPGAAPKEDGVEWSAFPTTATGTNQEIDDDRFRFQDEYVEWRVERTGGKLKQVTFTTEFPEYYEALAMVGVDALVAAIAAVIPGAKPKASELFGPGVDPAASTPEGRAARFTGFARDNPWNNGSKGILCLGQRFNTLGALFNLVGHGAVPNTSVASGAICAALGKFCGPARNSDPSIASAVQDLARASRGVSLRDPAGIEMVRLTGVWKRGGKQIDINDASTNSGLWTVTRGGRRAIFKNVANLTVDDDAISTGAQIASRLRVRAVVVSATEAELPAWSRIGQEESARLEQVAAAGSVT
jgi:hypothetical protein